MSETLNPYVVLGVDSDADDQRISAAYRRAVFATHPDRGGSAAAFARVQASYEILRDPAARAAYDDPPGEHETHDAPEDGRAYAERLRREAHERVARVVPTKAAAPVSPWYVAGAVGVFVALLLASAARGFGLAPHHAVGPGSYLMLGNFVMRGTYWTSMTSSHHGGSFVAALALALYSALIALPWRARVRYHTTTRPHEVVLYAVAVLVISLATETVLPSPIGVVAGVIGVVLWLSRASRQASGPRWRIRSWGRRATR